MTAAAIQPASLSRRRSFWTGTPEVYFTKALKKQGRFKLLREPIVTSGRKLRMHSARHILGRTVGIILRGKRGIRSRDNLDLWYDGKRETEIARKPAAGTAQE